MSKPYRIAIAGLGTVGVGVLKILEKHGDEITRRTGRRFEVVGISARDRNRDRGVDLSRYEWADNPASLAAMDCDAVVELIGGAEGIANELAVSTLKSGKAFVTANKALLAHHGHTLAEFADAHDTVLMYEAAVAGGIPIIKALREGFAANRISNVYGIMNGTCNFILTEMQRTGRDFDDVLKEAQDKGYAEVDPSFDIDGIDTAHKLCILTALSYGVVPDFENITVEGIRNITSTDIAFAGELGYRIKLLGTAKRLNGKIVQVVAPCLVPESSPIAAVDGSFNAVFAEGDFVGHSLSIGRGAGEGPTASAVVADLIDLARGSRLPVFGMSADDLDQADWAAPGEMVSHFYMHLVATDQPGVLADLRLHLHALTAQRVPDLPPVVAPACRRAGGIAAQTCE